MTGTFPSTLKTANVIPIYKKEGHILCNDYHSILLLPRKTCFSGGKLVHIRLTTLLNKNAIIYEKKFGFGNNHATTHALFEITGKIKQAVTQVNLSVIYRFTKQHLIQ